MGTMQVYQIRLPRESYRNGKGSSASHIHLTYRTRRSHKECREGFKGATRKGLKTPLPHKPERHKH